MSKNENAIAELKQYKHTVFVKFKQSGATMSYNVPHFYKWVGLLDFLNAKKYAMDGLHRSLTKIPEATKMFRVGFNLNGVFCVAELGHDFIKVQLGSFKNLWDDRLNFWDDPNDSRYTQLNDLEKKTLWEEINSVMEFVKEWK